MHILYALFIYFNFVFIQGISSSIKKDEAFDDRVRRYLETGTKTTDEPIKKRPSDSSRVKRNHRAYRGRRLRKDVYNERMNKSMDAIMNVSSDSDDAIVIDFIGFKTNKEAKKYEERLKRYGKKLLVRNCRQIIVYFSIETTFNF